ncbi:MAG: hypothetical protein V7L23_30140 [Nostoc sp.]
MDDKLYSPDTEMSAGRLNSECYVSREVRQQIEDTLLLPVETIP